MVVPPNSPDEGCFDAYQRELDYILRTLQRLGAPSSDLEDLAHEVFLVLRRAWPEYEASRPLRPYLFGIAFRVVSTHRRRYWREVAAPIVDELDAAPVPDEALESTEARALVLAALQKIPIARRVVLVMHDLDEVPMQEVAATLKIPLFTAYSRLRKARRELEACLVRTHRRSAIR